MLHREHEEIRAKYPILRWVHALVHALVPALRILLWPARRLMAQSLPGRYGRVCAWTKQSKFREAFELALESAPMCLRPRRFPYGDWWLFVAAAARCAGQLGDEERRRIIEVLPSAPEPGGREEASVLDQMSRWRWKENDAEGAMDLSRRAIEADPTWPYAHVTMAFYAKRSGMDPLPHLIDAVRADPQVRTQIESQFKDSPDLLAKLREAVQPS